MRCFYCILFLRFCHGLEAQPVMWRLVLLRQVAGRLSKKFEEKTLMSQKWLKDEACLKCMNSATRVLYCTMIALWKCLGSNLTFLYAQFCAHLEADA